VVGYLYGLVYELPGMLYRPVARLDALYVQEAHRGKGAGKALCRAFAALAAERGAVKMELKVFCRNAPALGLYEALGFRETKKYMERPL